MAKYRVHYNRSGLPHERYDIVEEVSLREAEEKYSDSRGFVCVEPENVDERRKWVLDRVARGSFGKARRAP